MSAINIITKFQKLRDVTWGAPSDGDVPAYDAGSGKLVMQAQTGGGGGGGYEPGGTDVAVADGGTGASTAAGARANLGLGTAATHDVGDFEVAGAAAAAQAASQPLDSDLTAIAALTTTSFGRAVLETADAAALRTAAGLGTAATHPASDFDSAGAAAAAQAASQPLDSDLTAIAALSTTSFGRALLALADAAALRTAASLIIGTDVQAYDAELAALAGLTSAADKVPYFTGSGTAALATLSSFIRTLTDDADAAAARTTLGAMQGGAGSSFPGSPSTNDRYFRTDLGLDFYYDGTRWLTVNEYAGFVSQMGVPNGTSGLSVTANLAQFALNQSLKTYLTKLDYNVFVLTTNNGSNYWTLALNYDTGGAIDSFNTSAIAASTGVTGSRSINTLVDPASHGSVGTVATKTGGPGQLYGSLVLRYRISTT